MLRCANPECRRELTGTMDLCTSNEPGGSCQERHCPGLRFCSSACISACWRKHNAFPHISYLVQPAIDEEAAAHEAGRLVEIVRLEQLWGRAA